MSNDTQPEIRFPGFTDDWEQRKLKEFGKSTGGTSIESEFVEGGKYKVISIGSYSEQSVYTDQNIRAELTDKTRNRVLNKGDLTMILNDKTASGNIIGRVLLIDSNDSYVYNQRTERIEPDHKKYDSQFLYHMLNAPMIRSKIIKQAQGNTQIYVNWSAIGELDYLVPNLDEQREIGAFFFNLNNLITLHQRKLDLLKETKKGFLQKMFPKNGAKVPEIRFPGFTEDWEQRKLGETKTYFTDGNYGESYPSSKDMSDKENGVPFLRGSDFSNGYLDSSNANYIKYEKHQELTSGHIKQDDIVIAVRGSLGTLGYANKENEGWNINSQLAILRTNKSEILGMFLIQYLLSNKGQKEILSRNTGTALKQLPIKQLKDIPIPMPAISEQQKIGTFFKQLDDTITLHQRKLDLLKETKKGFLQKMFV
ncbi:restriction endonuclease subunit S [Enterococcus faecium]|uniref:restriction endonuclease subunit S n=2 Tax=Enterococcus faecium TaxID=1352 RepID=UPI001D4798B1|nr:restriction endonuclease subunit S [Enterococcus faecium]NTR48437.1 restriction endonuclease subunit S [Enterococcus faecium]NTR52233.1 restriction endonuclease subunit S [Enterococcus faecium]NTS00336.1 restriction endonuclease subunit S [Enterococcus faecium]